MKVQTCIVMVLVAVLVATSLGQRRHHMRSRFDDFPAHLPYISGRYYGVPAGLTSAVGVAILNNKLYATPIQIHSPHKFDRLGFRVVDVDAGTANVVLGLYHMAPDGLPGDLHLASAEFSLNSSGIQLETISQVLSPGWYYLAMSTQVENSPTVGGVALGRHLDLFGSPDAAGAGSAGIISEFTYTGSMPDPFDRTGLGFRGFVNSAETQSDFPRIMLRAE